MLAGARPLALPVLFAVLLAGCAAPPQGDIRAVPLVDPLARSAECSAPPCAHEWWNLTIEGEGPYHVEVPLPLAGRGPHGGPPAEDPLDAWARHLRVDGDGVARATYVGGQPIVELAGEGPMRVTAYQRRAEGPVNADRFLLARWDVHEKTLRADAVDAYLLGAIDALVLTYEAHSDLCRRESRFELAAPLAPAAEQTVRLSGADRGWCP